MPPTAAPDAVATQGASGPAVLAGADGLSGGRALTVMTRNLYLGGDLLAVAAPGTQTPIAVRVAQLWQQILGSNFPERAGMIAREIEAAAPHLVGLQEVPIYRIDPVSDAVAGGTRPATIVALNFLATLRDSLAARGLCYNVATSAQLMDAELPMIVSTNPLAFSDPALHRPRRHPRSL